MKPEASRKAPLGGRYSRFLGLTLLLAAARAEARPYYAALKGLSCAACHVAPAGAGMRAPTPDSPGKITDTVSMGADMRVFLSRTEASKQSSFALGRTSLYVSAEPRPDMQIVLQQDLDESYAAQAYGIWRAQDGLPFYVRAGRFWLPYGIQWDDPDNSMSIHGSPYAPGVGFDMSATASDTGIEAGLAPKKDYFLNVSATNGKPGGGGDNNDEKAITARVGYINKLFMIGGTFFRNKSGPTPADSVNLRYGPIAWIRLNRAVLLYEGGFGRDTPNTGGASVAMRSHAAELDVDLHPGWLFRFHFDSMDPNIKVNQSKTQRYTFGVERLMDFVSVELQYRIHREIPEIVNNQVFLQAHVWF